MSTYEVLTLLIHFGMFLITLLAYINRNNKQKSHTPLLCNGVCDPCGIRQMLVQARHLAHCSQE